MIDPVFYCTELAKGTGWTREVARKKLTEKDDFFDALQALSGFATPETVEGLARCEQCLRAPGAVEAFVGVLPEGEVARILQSLRRLVVVALRGLRAEEVGRVALRARE